MGGLVASIGDFFNSTPGRVLTGVATGGTSEVVRGGVSLTKHNTNLDPEVAQGVGAVLGGTTAQQLGVSTRATGPTSTVPGKTAAGVDPLSAASGTAQAAEPMLDPAPVTVPTLGTPIIPPAGPRPQTAQEEYQARLRALDARQRLGQSTRASDHLTTTRSLG